MRTRNAFVLLMGGLLALTVYQMYDKHIQRAQATIRFEYTANNEISAVDFEKSEVSFSGFLQYVGE